LGEQCNRPCGAELSFVNHAAGGAAAFAAHSRPAAAADVLFAGVEEVTPYRPRGIGKRLPHTREVSALRI